MMNKLQTMLVIAAVGLGATSLFAHDRAVLLPMPASQTASIDAWTASNAGTPPSGISAVGTDGVTRRVVVSGYHPLAGFEAETAAEQAALAGDGAAATPKGALPLR